MSNQIQNYITPTNHYTSNSYYYKFCISSPNANFQYVYPKAKSLNTTVYPLYENPHFYDLDVSLNFSTVHVPTNVYDEC